MKKILIFGAGKIGRSLIGLLFSKSGYEVVFIDVDKFLVGELNKRGAYKIIHKGTELETILVENFRAIHFEDTDEICKELINADIISVSVRKNDIAELIPLLTKTIICRHHKRPDYPLDIIIAINMLDPAEHFRIELIKNLPADFPFETYIGCVETSIGKMVPIMGIEDLKKDPLQIFAEPFNDIILDEKGFRNPVPQVPNLIFKENMKAWVDRKVFIHNLGHAVSAYVGFLEYPGLTHLHEIMEKDRLKTFVRETMLESAAILVKIYPEEYTFLELSKYIDELILRFENKALNDTVYRLGCDIQRKLSRDDRLTGALIAARIVNMPADKILYTILCALHFKAVDREGKLHPNDILFHQKYANTNTGDVLVEVCELNPQTEDDLIQKATKMHAGIISQFNLEIK